MGKKTADADRKARVEQMRRQQEAAERRRTLMIGSLVGVVIVALIGVVFYVIRDYQGDRDPANVGLSASAAGCDPVIDDKAEGTQQHVGPGTEKADTIKVNYKMIPPSSGEHYAQWDASGTAFHTEKTRPPKEELVHNLEHGYTVVWYTSDTPKAQLDQLKDIAERARQDESTNGKFIVSAWDDSYGKFPAGKKIGMSHWGAKDKSHRQLCGQVSGEAIAQFIKKFPYTDSPEPNGG